MHLHKKCRSILEGLSCSYGFVLWLTLRWSRFCMGLHVFIMKRWWILLRCHDFWQEWPRWRVTAIFLGQNSRIHMLIMTKCDTNAKSSFLHLFFSSVLSVALLWMRTWSWAVMHAVVVSGSSTTQCAGQTVWCITLPATLAAPPSTTLSPPQANRYCTHSPPAGLFQQ